MYTFKFIIFEQIFHRSFRLVTVDRLMNLLFSCCSSANYTDYAILFLGAFSNFNMAESFPVKSVYLYIFYCVNRPYIYAQL